MKWIRRGRRDEAPTEALARAAFDALRGRIDALPREAEPARDLWQGVRNRIELGDTAPHRGVLRARLQIPVWAAGALATLLVATTLGTALWLGGAPSLDDPGDVRRLADALRERDGMDDVRHDLLALLEERRDRLPPEVVAAVEKNLVEIDRAIAEIHLAFQEHPESGALQFLLAEAYHREVEILEQLEWWTRERAPEAHS
jgi:hypothetical protein